MKNIGVDGIFQILKGLCLIKFKLGDLHQPEHAYFGPHFAGRMVGLLGL